MTSESGRQDSNLRSPASEAGALNQARPRPESRRGRTRTSTPRIRSAVLCPLSYAPNGVEAAGFEPASPWFQTRRAARLRHASTCSRRSLFDCTTAECDSAPARPSRVHRLRAGEGRPRRGQSFGRPRPRRVAWTSAWCSSLPRARRPHGPRRVPTLPTGALPRRQRKRAQARPRQAHGERQTSAELELELRPEDVVCRRHGASIARASYAASTTASSIRFKKNFECAGTPNVRDRPARRGDPRPRASVRAAAATAHASGSGPKRFGPVVPFWNSRMMPR
jgi:hypothetical protein